MTNYANYRLSNWYYLGILLMLSFCTRCAMLDMDNMADSGTGLSFIAMLGLSVIQIPLLLFILRERFKNRTEYIRFIPWFVLCYGLYFIWMTIITILADDTHNIMGLITISLTILVFPFILSCSYFRARYSDLDSWFYLAVIFLMLCICLQYKNIYSLANVLATDKSHIGISYFPLFVLPILLLPSSRLIRYASIVVTSIIIISSIKRGGLIALGASLMVYVLVKQFVNNKSSLRLIIIFVAVILVMGGVLYYITESTDNNIIDRISNISDDGGSGRDVLWEDTYRNIQNRDISYRLVGNGYRSTELTSSLQLPAHNDFLEIWHDFGGIGLALYLLSFLSLCLYTLRLIKRKSRYAPYMAMIIVYYFIFSMISIVILYPLTALLLFTIGIIAGLADREFEEKVRLENVQNSSSTIVINDYEHT